MAVLTKSATTMTKRLQHSKAPQHVAAESLQQASAITQRLHSSSFLGLAYRILNRNPKKELLWSLRVFDFSQNKNQSEIQFVGSKLKLSRVHPNPSLTIGPKVVPFWDYLIKF